MAEKTPVGDMPRMVPDRDDIRRRVAPTQPDRNSNTKSKEPIPLKIHHIQVVSSKSSAS